MRSSSRCGAELPQTAPAATHAGAAGAHGMPHACFGFPGAREWGRVCRATANHPPEWRRLRGSVVSVLD
jgi:hypothetical protein